MRWIVMGAVVCSILAARPATAASPFDGVYSGATTWAGNGNSCNGAVPEFKVTVRDGKFNYGGGGSRVPVEIGADGKFSAQSGQRYLQGRISGNQMSATSSGGCNYIWELRKP